ncbi:MAG: hypothetical protein VX642_12510 [Bdellovibrionota bacterium]|nr:hypothetical protein [Bdellovibrionota bacterium]
MKLELIESQVGLPSNSALGINGSLPEPQNIPGKMRIVFFVDQSTSMIRERCIQELDWQETLPDLQRRGNTQDCQFKAGIDVDGTRFTLIKEWIEYLESFGDRIDVEYAVLPFSGGIKQRPNVSIAYDSNMKFSNASEALFMNDKLLEEHNTDKQAMMADMASTPQFLGTTVPMPVLEYSKSLIKVEMDKLNEMGSLGETDFHFIYISDGIFKPKESLFDKAREILGCKDCTKNENYSDPSCARTAPSGFKCEYKVGSQTVYGCMYHVCNIYLHDAMVENWGDPAQNDYDLIKNTIQEIKNLKNYYFDANIETHFVSLYPEKQQVFSWEPGNKYWSLFDGLKADFPEDNYIEYTGGGIPFTFNIPGDQDIHFSIENFYAINLNLSVNSFKRLALDSDSDGISDDLEIALGYDPSKQRTNGICLDVIAQKYRCDEAITLSCFPYFDYDGDGLNQCEELLLNTNEKSADTDNDGVLDGHEIIRGLNPRKDDAYDMLSSDDLSAMDHFRRGVHPMIAVESVIENNRIDLRIDQNGQTKFTGEYGTTYYAPNLVIDVKNLPLADIPSFDQNFYFSRNIKDPSEYNPLHYLMGQSHSENTNEILFVLKTRQVQKPDQVNWFMKRVIMNSKNPNTIQLNLSDFEVLDLIEQVEQ